MVIEGLTRTRCNFGPKETMDRLESALKKRNIGIFARIDHAGGAEKAGFALRPTELLLFGNPKTGTPLMQAAQTAGIDLPLKALVWQDSDGVTWLGYNEPAWIAARHDAKGAERVVAAMKTTLSDIAQEVASDVRS